MFVLLGVSEMRTKGFSGPAPDPSQVISSQQVGTLCEKEISGSDVMPGRGIESHVFSLPLWVAAPCDAFIFR